MNDPYVLFSASVPWAGPDTSTAVIALTSASKSLPSTPGAATTSGVSSAVVYESFAPTGASFTGVTTTVTGTHSLVPVPSEIW